MIIIALIGMLFFGYGSVSLLYAAWQAGMGIEALIFFLGALANAFIARGLWDMVSGGESIQ